MMLLFLWWTSLRRLLLQMRVESISHHDVVIGPNMAEDFLAERHCASLKFQ